MKFSKAFLPIVVTCFSLSPARAADSPATGSKPAETKPAAAVPAPPFLQQLNDGFSGLYEKAAPSVVIINSTMKESAEDSADGDGLEFFFRNPQGRSEPRRMPMPQGRKSEGSGFIVKADGYIFTNNHVVEGAEKIDVKLKDGRHFTGKVVGTDERSDIAVVKIEATGLPVLEFADSDAVKVGQMVCSIGVPFSLDYSFACGWVSGKGRTGLTQTTYEDYIQTDSFVNPGDSGGPVLDITGKVIGMNTLINGIGRKLTFAIPSNMLKDIGYELISDGKVSHPWLGIVIATVGDDSPAGQSIKGIDHGVIVSKIAAGAPAYKSELRVADVITQVDGREVASAHDLQKEIQKTKVGQNVNLTVWRDGKISKVAVTTGELPNLTQVSNVAPKKDTKAPAPEAGKIGNDFGFNVQDLTKDQAEKLKVNSPEGALVTDITANSPAAVGGLQRDDVITGVDSQQVTNAATCKALIEKHDNVKAMLLFIDRKGQKTYAVLKADQ